MRFLVLCFSILSIAVPLNVIANSKRKTISTPKTEFPKTDPRFDKYKRLFEYEYRRYTGVLLDSTPVIINLVDNPNTFCKDCTSPKAGLCTRFGTSREILIKKSTYNNSTPEQREELMFHELAHCAVDWDHNNTTYKGQPVSIMSKAMFSDKSYYKRHRRALLKELFTGEIDEIVKGIDSDEGH